MRETTRNISVITVINEVFSKSEETGSLVLQTLLPKGLATTTGKCYGKITTFIWSCKLGPYCLDDFG
jgi:hypothetical protein